MLSEDFAFPFIGHAQWLGFLEDFFAVAVLLAIIWFAIIRLRNAPDRRAAGLAASTARTPARRG